MALANIKARVKKAQENAQTGEALERLAALLDRGAYYDELTEEEKNAYSEYMDIERDALERVNALVTGNLHFQLERRPKPPTKEEFRRAAAEVEAMVNAYREAYNAPEAQAKRAAEYEEIQRIGAQRRAASMRGEDMDNYPLPWERKAGSNGK